MDIMTAVIAYITTWVLIIPIARMLENSGAVRPNYAGRSVPVGLGIVFVPAVITSGAFAAINLPEYSELILLSMLGMTVMGLVGIADDLLGNREVLGFTGHIKSLIHGRLTTGGLKAIIGGMISAVISLFISETALAWLLNTLVIALFTNLVNLTDLRPGRAVKFFFIALLFTFFRPFNVGYGFIIAPVAGALAAYAPVDLKAGAMMGDTGSNLLGISLGLYFCLKTPVAYMPVLVIALLAIQVVGERYSFSRIIDANKFLRYIDNLGRGR